MLKLPLLIFIIILSSCTNSEQESKTVALTDTTPMGNDTSEVVTKVQGESKQNDKIHNDLDGIKIIEYRIFYDTDFNPYLSAKIKNNLNVSITAFKVVLNGSRNPKSKCNKEFIEKTRINPMKIVTINKKLDKDCNFDNAAISILECITSDGKKLSTVYYINE